MDESRIYDIDRGAVCLIAEASEAVLISLSPLFALYRVTIDGKHFFFKTAAADKLRIRQILKREYELGAGCDHPGILRSTFFGEVLPGEEGILIEHEEGRSLTDFLAENPTKAVRKRIFRELLDAVEYIHRKGLVHNDLRPENILITYYGDRLKLLDCGLSDVDVQFATKSPGFSPQYAAPELQQERRSDSRSDIYSLGRLMETIFGRRYRHIVQKSVAELPGDRYQTLRELRKAYSRRSWPLLGWSAGALFMLVAAGAVVLAFSGEYEWWSAEKGSHTQKGDGSLNELEVDSLQTSYRLLSEKYAELNTTYQMLRDSVDRAREDKENHQKAVEDHIVKFKEELDGRIQRALTHVRGCRTAGEAAAYISRFSDDMENFYRGYPKVVDGEDMSSAVSNTYHTAISHTEEFLRIVATLPN